MNYKKLGKIILLSIIFMFILINVKAENITNSTMNITLINETIMENNTINESVNETKLAEEEAAKKAEEEKKRKEAEAKEREEIKQIFLPFLMAFFVILVVIVFIIILYFFMSKKQYKSKPSLSELEKEYNGVMDELEEYLE